MSSSSKINFSEIEKSGAEDYNDQGALNKALGKLTFKQPETFGGQFKDPAKKKTIYEQFNTHTPPDITAKTRIVGVCGVLQEAAHPQADGWFVSDFLAFWHLFSGTTEHQTWMHCLDLEDLVTKHTRYLHGNPYKERKVVLDAEILDKALKSKHPPVPLKPAGFRAKVVQKIREQCALSRIGKENVLILLFGHGHYKTHGIWLGGGETTDNPSTKVLKLDELQKAIKDTATKVTLLTTHCFSGGWTCNPAVNITAMTAAGHVQESFLWRGSGSSGRYCGSMFATVVIEKLTRYGNDSRKLGESSTVDDEEEEPTEEQMETYSAFSKSVYQTLLEDVDRRGYAHEMSFGAQDDAWEMCWRERTGIPLARFEQRWRCLQTWPADQTLLAGDPQNRDPRVTQEAKDEYGRRLKEAREGKVQYAVKKAHEASGGVLGKRKTSALFGGTDESLVRVVSSLGTQYLASYGPADDSGTDGGLSNTIQRIRSGAERDMGRIQRALTAIEYRMETMATADRYLQIMQIERPRGQRCFEYDARNLRGRVDSKRYDALKALLCDREILFPEPMEDQGQPFFKGIEYLIAAFTAADCAKNVVIKKLDDLASILDGELEVEKEVVKRDPEVVSKRRKLFHAFGRLRDMSPDKRNSRS